MQISKHVFNFSQNPLFKFFIKNFEKSSRFELFDTASPCYFSSKPVFSKRQRKN